MKLRVVLGTVAVLLLLTGAFAPVVPNAARLWAQEEKTDDEGKSLAELLPRIPPVEPSDALATFQLEHGFHLEQVAAEPAVCDPVDACFDENGRMYVAEMRGYPYSSEPRAQCPEGIGRHNAGVIRLLEDTNGDGKLDRSVVFADDISWPTSVCCYRGGVFVVAPPHLYYFKDGTGDGRADVREIVYSGFLRDNVQSLANNMKWSLDNRITAATGRMGGKLTHRGNPLVDLGRRDIAFNPATEALEPITGGSQFGHSFDDWGNRFVCSNSDHIQHVVFDNRYLQRNPGLAAPRTIRSIGKEGPAAVVYRRSQAEPWRIVRTKRRVNDPRYATRLPATELVPTGFFTSATGVTIYRGGVYPPEFQGNAFVGDVGGNLVHRKTLQPQAASFLAVRADHDTEFLTSTDVWFRPVNFVNAPDGTLYILDMYRETIEHPVSIPPDIKAHLDLESGHDRGRIYRLVSPNMQRIKPPKLGEANVRQLVAELESPNSWNRETAQRLLWERQDKSAVEPLRRLAGSSQSALGRLHALWTLDGLNALDAETLIPALKDEHPGVREHAVRLAEPRAASSPQLVEQLLALADDPEYRVRLQLAFSLGELPDEAANRGLQRLARRIGADADLRTAFLSSTAGRAGALAVELVKDDEFHQHRGSSAVLAELSKLVGADKNPRPAVDLLASAVELDGRLAVQQLVLRSLGEGLSRRGSSVSQLLATEAATDAVRVQARRLFDQAVQIAASDGKPQPERQAAVTLLGFADFETAARHLPEFLTPQTPQELQLAAVDALATQDDPQVGRLLLSEWRSYSPRVRREVVEALLGRTDRTRALLAALEGQTVRLADIERDKQQLLTNHPNGTVRTQARKLFGQLNTNRAEVVAAYQPALELEGDAARGREVFRKLCSVCHQVGDEGHKVAPDLASAQNKSPEDLLISILDPNRESQPNFNTYTVVTLQGRTMSGIITAESATSLTLTRAEAKQDVVLRSNIDELVSNGVSLMPEGLEKEISVEQMADLIEFVKTIAPAEK